MAYLIFICISDAIYHHILVRDAKLYTELQGSFTLVYSIIYGKHSNHPVPILSILSENIQ
jgi:hypothetical protein